MVHAPRITTTAITRCASRGGRESRNLVDSPRNLATTRPGHDDVPPSIPKFTVRVVRLSTAAIQLRALPRRMLPMLPTVTPQLVGNTGLRALRAAIAEPQRFSCEPKVDGVRGLIVYADDRLETRNRAGIRRDWLRGDAFEAGIRRLAARLPILWDGTIIDGEVTAGRFETTMAALFGSREHRPNLRFARLRRAGPRRRRSGAAAVVGASRPARARRASVRCPVRALADRRADALPRR